MLLSYYLPYEEGIGWIGIVVFLFLYFVGEPLYRQVTNRWEIHILVLEIYVFSAFMLQLLFPVSPFAYLFYVIPIFSSALSFGLMGTMLTSMGIFGLELVRRIFPAGFTQAGMGEVLEDTLPVFILALILGFTVELKNRIERELLNRLSRMEAFQTLKDSFSEPEEPLPFGQNFLDRLVDLIDVKGALVIDTESDEVLARSGLAVEHHHDSPSEKTMSDSSPAVYPLEFIHAEKSFELRVFGKRERGILGEAEERMMEALEGYIQHLVDHHRIQYQRDREIRYRKAIFDTVPVGICILDKTGVIEEENSVARGWLPESENKQAGEIFVIEGDPLRLERLRREATLKYTDQGDDQEKTIPVDLALEPIEIEDNNLKRWILVFRDLRPIKELEEKAARKRRLVALGELAAGLAHEIRNPVGSLSGFISLLEQQIEDEDSQELVGKIRSSYDRIEQLVEQFLEYAREPRPHQEKIKLETITREIIDKIDLPDEIVISLEAEDSSPPTIHGDPHRFELILRNLIRNSRDAMETGEINISLSEAESCVRLTVSDTGEGIRSERLSNVFDPFVSFKDHGLGLGLSTVHRIVTEEFRGEISIDSSEAVGTTVEILFPMISNDSRKSG